MILMVCVVQATMQCRCQECTQQKESPNVTCGPYAAPGLLTCPALPRPRPCPCPRTQLTMIRIQIGLRSQLTAAVYRKCLRLRCEPERTGGWCGRLGWAAGVGRGDLTGGVGTSSFGSGSRAHNPTSHPGIACHPSFHAQHTPSLCFPYARSAGARASMPSGRVVNLMSADVAKICDFLYPQVGI